MPDELLWIETYGTIIKLKRSLSNPRGGGGDYSGLNGEAPPERCMGQLNLNIEKKCEILAEIIPRRFTN